MKVPFTGLNTNWLAAPFTGLASPSLMLAASGGGLTFEAKLCIIAAH